MVQVTVTQGMSIEIVLARMLRENGLHVVRVHNGVITHHGKLERVRNEGWVLEGMKKQKSRKRPKKSGKEAPEAKTLKDEEIKALADET